MKDANAKMPAGNQPAVTQQKARRDRYPVFRCSFQDMDHTK